MPRARPPELFGHLPVGLHHVLVARVRRVLFGFDHLVNRHLVNGVDTLRIVGLYRLRWGFVVLPFAFNRVGRIGGVFAHGADAPIV
jgi:hypothetical protein